MLDKLMQLSQVVAWNANVHVVLRVVVHMPVEKTDDRVRDERSAAETKVGCIVLQADMLGVVAEEEKPASVKRRKGCYDGQEPALCAD